MTKNLTEQEVENVADCLKEVGFEFDSFHTDNETYIKIIHAVLTGLNINLDGETP